MKRGRCVVAPPTFSREQAVWGPHSSAARGNEHYKAGAARLCCRSHFCRMQHACDMNSKAVDLTQVFKTKRIGNPLLFVIPRLAAWRWLYFRVASVGRVSQATVSLRETLERRLDVKLDCPFRQATKLRRFASVIIAGWHSGRCCFFVASTSEASRRGRRRFVRGDSTRTQLLRRQASKNLAGRSFDPKRTSRCRRAPCQSLDFFKDLIGRRHGGYIAASSLPSR